MNTVTLDVCSLTDGLAAAAAAMQTGKPSAPLTLKVA